MKKRLLYTVLGALSVVLYLAALAQDTVADNMLLYQRSVGGWPKHISNIKLDYTKALSPAAKAGVLDDKFRNDATIDNGATTKEIRYLVKAFAQSGNRAYLAAAENGVRYLLAMQYPNGGFPQFYPDTTFYRSQVTYNDNAMVNALNVLWDVAYRQNGMEVVDASLQPGAKAAVDNGIACILKTQLTVGGQLAGWCAQYNEATLQPEKARAFELASISGMESVAIVEFLMKAEKPTAEIVRAITGAAEWFQRSKINGFRYTDVNDVSLPQGRDRRLVADSSSAVWARFYDLQTNQPFFCGRDGIKRWHLSEIEHERRTGYAWYGTLPASLLDKKWPAWKKKHNIL